MDRIEQEVRDEKKRIWLQRIKGSKFAIGFLLVIVLILSWNIYRSSDKVVESEKLLSVLVGIHQVQTNLGSSPTMLSIKVNNGEYVMAPAPDNFVVRNNTEVEVIRGKTKQGSVYYYFSSYKELK